MTRQLTDEDIRIGDLVYVNHESTPMLGLVMQLTKPDEKGREGLDGACVIAYLHRTETFGSYTGFGMTIMNMKYVTKTGRNLSQWLGELPKPQQVPNVAEHRT